MLPDWWQRADKKQSKWRIKWFFSSWNVLRFKFLSWCVLLMMQEKYLFPGRAVIGSSIASFSSVFYHVSVEPGSYICTLPAFFVKIKNSSISISCRTQQISAISALSMVIARETMLQYFQTTVSACPVLPRSLHWVYFSRLLSSLGILTVSLKRGIASVVMLPPEFSKSVSSEDSPPPSVILPDDNKN